MHINGEAVADVAIERSLACALIREPALLDSMPERWGVDRHVDLQSIAAIQAAIRLRAAGKTVDLKSVKKELERSDGHHDHDWLDRIMAIRPDAPPASMISGWIDTVVRFDEKRRKAIADAEVTAQDSTAKCTAPTNDVHFGRPFLEYIGDVEPDDNPADVFDVHGLIVRGEPGLAIGAPKVGKTLLQTDLALHMAAGRKEWCGVPIYRRCRVLLFLREDSERTSVRRIWQLARGAGIDHRELAEHLVIDSTSPLYFDDPKLTDRLERQLKDFDICLIDSLSTIHNADENSVERMTPIMNRWRDMSLGTKTGIPLIHHFRKQGNDGHAGVGILQRARGSSIIAATTRHAVGVERGPTDHQLVLSVESNHEVDTEPFVIERRFGVDKFGRKFITHARIGNLSDAKSASEIALLDPIALEAIRAAGFDGIGTRALRATVIEAVRDKRGSGIRPAKVDAAAKRLEERGVVTRVSDRWRFST